MVSWLIGCSDGEVRLVNGSVATEGRLEICLDKKWGIVCDDLFTNKNADVVCRQLGYPTDGIFNLFLHNKFYILQELYTV